MRFNSLDSWLNWQQSLNPKAIDLGLGRVRKVFDRLNLPKIANRVITVAGTNGKGSTVACYETWLKNSGYKVASYTSPHLIKYNERIKLNLETVSDDNLCHAFSVIDEAREELTLTYFEFGTLAAFYLMSQFKPDVAILEVGLGGRLDAVNIIDADLAHITPVGLDHQDWLGDSIELIAFEKAGILRQNVLAICNMSEPPGTLADELTRLKTRSSMLTRDYQFKSSADGFIEWSNKEFVFKIKPPLLGIHQALNISGVLQGLYLLGFFENRSEKQIVNAFHDVKCAGRLQQIQTSLPLQIWLDVGHNQDAAVAIANAISEMNVKGRVYLLFGMLSDKNPVVFTSKLKSVVDEWWLLDLDGDRGLSAEQLAESISGTVQVTKKFSSAKKSLEQAVLSLDNQDILLVCGSFMTIAAVLDTLLSQNSLITSFDI